MGTSVKQDNDFIVNVISGSLLEDAIEWIRQNMNPGDVFTEDQLDQWATENDWEKE